MPRRIGLLIIPVLFGTSLAGQNLGPRPLSLPQGDSPIQTTPQANAAKTADPEKQLAELRKLADGGDGEAAFQVGVVYLLGQGVGQDSAVADGYFQKAEMTPLRKCFVAEAYMETSLPGRVEQAKRWATGADSGCGYWEIAQWYGGLKLGPDQEKEIEALREGLTARDDGFQVLMRGRLGELVLQKAIDAGTPAERVAWMGEAARARLGQAELGIAWMYTRHVEETASPATYLGWIRKAVRYRSAAALGILGQAAMTREVSDLSYLDGMALYHLGARQDILAGAGEEAQVKQLEPEQREELLNAAASWNRVAHETGGYYLKDDPLRLAEPIDMDALAGAAKAENPDAELRLAYVYETKGKLSEAETLYREVWKNGGARLWFALAEEAGKAGKWSWARELYESAAAVGSRAACAELARMSAEGLGGHKDAVGAYLWLLRAESKDGGLLAARKKALTSDQFKSVELSQAKWLLAHKDFWMGDLKAAQAVVDASQPTQPMNFGLRGVASKPVPTAEEWRKKADAGDADAAYEYAVDLLWGKGGAHPSVELIEGYAAKGAKTAEQKAHIADGYARSGAFDQATQRKYAEKWYLATGGSQGLYQLAKVYNGKSDGIVESDDEKKAVEYWRRAVESKDERWARLSRMELGYRVVKGWSSGDRALDAAWAHELALEMMGKEFYGIAGEYSYGRELPHDPQTYLHLAERAAVYNIDNAQGAVDQAILDGTWKHGDNSDAMAWMKLRVVKQDVGDAKLIADAEENPERKAKIEARYGLLMKTRAESGAFYLQDDPLRTADAGELEARVKEQDPEAQLRLGAILEQEGTAAGRERAIALYRQIWATAGQEVRLTWGRTLMNGGAGVARDDVGAEKWLWDAANSGSHEACRLLAVIYQEGRGVKADPIAAEAWRALAGDGSIQNADITGEEKSAVAARVADWKTKHPNW